MNIDILFCNGCEEFIADCTLYTVCADCNAVYCENCTVVNYNEDDEEVNKVTCEFCTLSSIRQEDLLNFALLKLNISKEGLEALYREKYNEGG